MKHKTEDAIFMNKKLILGYEDELLSHKNRIAAMEKAELGRIVHHLENVEYKATNAGKSKGYFF